MTYIVISLLLLPLFAVLSALDSPGGVLVLLVPRYQRHVYRKRRPRAKQRSARISNRLRTMVERADRRRCVYCHARWQPGAERFPVDHMVPWLMGGLTCLWNCALLCKRCNSVKSCYWVAPSGHVYYRGRGRPPAQAPLILAAERRARWSPWRWLRAYGLLPSW